MRRHGFPGNDFVGRRRRPWAPVVHACLIAACWWAVPTHAETDPAPATEPTSVVEAFKRGTVTLALRYRFEGVEQDGFSRDASASTLRTALSYRTGAYRGFSLLLEAENVTALGDERYNNAGQDGLGNGVTNRPVVADPEITEVNQAYVRFARGATRVDVGRQAINRGDQRFVGAVAWRQNHQSFDAVSIQQTFETRLDEVIAHYAFVDNVNRVVGDNRAMASHLLDVAVTLPVGTLTGYGYRLDFDRSATLSTTTIGLELRGQRDVGPFDLLYEAEWANQSDTGDNPRDVDADYRHLRLGGRKAGVTAEVGWEVLEGSPGNGSFQTPLATLHKWNGWADKFLATPADGLEDVWVSIAGKAGSIAWRAVYHDFAADSSSRDFGTELDLQLIWTSDWQQVFGLKAAFYDADQHATDTDKVWLWTQYTF